MPSKLTHLSAQKSSILTGQGEFRKTFYDALDRFMRGEEWELYRYLGAHCKQVDGVWGVYFVLWAPNARQVAVVGDFNHWMPESHPMTQLLPYGVWELFVPHIGHGELYKFYLIDAEGKGAFRADPMAFWSEKRPNNASIIYDSHYKWEDREWMKNRPLKDAKSLPMNIYEVHLGSWKGRGAALGYRHIAHELVPYVKKMGYTHIELLPILEYPLDDSWGYQVTGYFAPTSRYGHPDDLRYLIDLCHQENIAVLLDWVPSHFPKDRDHLALYDGTALYEHLDPKLGYQPQWDTYLFNYGRYEVQSFLISSALYWCREFHIDGLRVDAVTSMLYLNFGKEEGQWEPNADGGCENREAIAWLRKLNQVIHQEEKGVITLAEESTAFPGVTKPLADGGLGFDFKWMMGWMHDTLGYFKIEPLARKWHHNKLTFNMIYFYDEAFVLPLSHDEVVHLKKSLFSKMVGSDKQKAAELLLLYSYAICFPGKKLFFMGIELGQKREWSFQQELSWFLLDLPLHQELHEKIAFLNHLYLSKSAFWQYDHDPMGFCWLHFNDHDRSMISYIRKSDQMTLLCIHHFGDGQHPDYLIPMEKTTLPFTKATLLFGPQNHQGHILKNAFYLNLDPLTTYIYELS